MKVRYISGVAAVVTSAFLLAPAVAVAATSESAAPVTNADATLNPLVEPYASIYYWACTIGRAINSSYIPNVTPPPCVYGQQT